MTQTKQPPAISARFKQVVGVPREELGGKAYLTRDLDPHALVAEAMKETAA